MVELKRVCFKSNYANLVILQYLCSPFTWDKVFKVLRPLPNHVKNQRLLVHILYYILFNYLDEMLKTMFKLLFTSHDTIVTHVLLSRFPLCSSLCFYASSNAV